MNLASLQLLLPLRRFLDSVKESTIVIKKNLFQRDSL